MCSQSPPWVRLGRTLLVATLAGILMVPPSLAGSPEPIRIGEVTGSVIGPDRSIRQGIVTLDLLGGRTLRIGLSDRDSRQGSVEFRLGPAVGREVSRILAAGLKLLAAWEGESRIRTESFLLADGGLLLQAVSSPSVFASPFLAVVIDGSRTAPVLYLSKRRVGELRDLIARAMEQAVIRDRT